MTEVVLVLFHSAKLQNNMSDVIQAVQMGWDLLKFATCCIV